VSWRPDLEKRKSEEERKKEREQKAGGVAFITQLYKPAK